MKGIILFSDKLKDSWLNQEKNKQVLMEIGGFDVFCNQIIAEVNLINSKYSISEIRFVNFDEIEELFNLKSIPAGYIVEERNMRYIPNAYICISNPDVGSRNAMGAQHLFPALSYLTEKYLNAPGYELTNLPIYFVYGSKDLVTESIRQSIIAMQIMGVKCIPIFDNGAFLTADIRSSISETLRGYANYNLWEYAALLSKETADYHDEVRTDYFIVNKGNKTIKFINESFINGALGSRDRFFVIKAYPALILADNMKYNIDFDEIVKYVNNSGNGRSNFLPFIHYAEKLVKRRNM